MCRLVIPLVASAMLAVPPNASAQSDTLWRYTAPAPIKFTQVDAAGNLVVATESLLVAVHADSGRTVWTHAVRGRTWVFRTVLSAYFLVGYGHTVTALDPATGETVWHRSDLPDLSHTSFVTFRDQVSALLQTKDGFAVLDLRTGMTQWDSTALPTSTVVREYFPLFEHNVMLLLARTPLNNSSLIAVTIDSGRVLWRHDSLFQTPPRFKRERGVESITEYQSPIILSDTTLLIYLSTDGPMRLDPRTGAVRWRASALAGVPVGSRTDGYPAPRLIDSLLLVATQQQLVALDTATGQIGWRTDKDFRDRPTWIVARHARILVGGFGRTKSFLTTLDPATGRRNWPADLNLKTAATAYFKDDTAYVSDGGVFAALPLATGKRSEIAMIGFEGNEQPSSIDTVEGGGFLLAARQNLLRVGSDGRVAYRRYYKAPGASFWAKLGSTALILAANVASYAATPPGGLAPIIVRNPMLSTRYGRASQAVNYYYLFTEAPDSLGQKGFSLVLLDRRDGRELGRLWFDDRSPDYVLDHVSATVYVRDSDREVVARRFRF